MLIVLAELKVSVSNCEKMSHKIASSRLRFSRDDGTFKDLRTSSHHSWADYLTLFQSWGGIFCPSHELVPTKFFDIPVGSVSGGVIELVKNEKERNSISPGGT
jgi:hypothetical protein